MNLQNYYWFFKSALSDKFCNEVIKYGNLQQEELALIGSHSNKKNKGEDLTDKDIKDLKKKRDSNIVWLDDRWIYKEIHPYIHIANKNAGWNFQWDFSESCQFTKYKLNQYYDWHCDSWDKPYGEDSHDNHKGKIRKLSVTVSLSNPKDYEGGEFEFDYRNLDPDKKQNIIPCKEIVDRGSIVVFPSHLWHRVQAVTKGTRYSLVLWNLGYPFK
jgi:PKHD-type hydroxylase